MLLHAKHASASCTSVIIKSPDTDVLVLAVGLAAEIDAEIFMSMGSSKVVRNVNASSVSRHLGRSESCALIGLHCFTGCDSVSAFKNKGKVRGLNMMLSTKPLQDSFAQLGTLWSPSDEIVSNLEDFVCTLYGEKECKDIDEVRFRLFCRYLRPEDMLPPTKDSLILHIKRANYQAAIHRLSLCQHINAPSPTDHGWEVVDDKLKMKWMTLPPTPDDVLHVLSCGCPKTSCETARCKCRAAGSICTDMCKCQNCHNTPEKENEQIDFVELSDNERDTNYE